MLRAIFDLIVGIVSLFVSLITVAWALVIALLTGGAVLILLAVLVILGFICVSTFGIIML